MVLDMCLGNGVCARAKRLLMLDLRHKTQVSMRQKKNFDTAVDFFSVYGQHFAKCRVSKASLN